MRNRTSTAAWPGGVPSRSSGRGNFPTWKIRSVFASGVTALTLAIGLVAWPGSAPASAIEAGLGLEGENTNSVVQVLKGGEGQCTGNVMGPDLVLTATHCLSGGPVSSLTILSGSQHRGQGTRHEVSEVDRRGDLLLLRVETNAPIEMAGDQYFEIAQNEPLTVGRYLFSYGFGRTCSSCPLAEKLRATQPAVASVKSTIRDREDGLGYKVKPPWGARLWPGDSGGPSFYKAGNKRVLFGIASRGKVDLTGDEIQWAVMSATYDYPDCGFDGQPLCVHQWLIGNGVKEYVPARVHDEFKRDIYVGT
ncbi:trypsin-like serine protease, partial [Streptomyces zaomyceticus]|uniref:trypsin-like serine protease n=1 Tax=Streptomyces zaomyceticus TaxID=68286 RepID=UPI0036B43E56